MQKDILRIFEEQNPAQLSHFFYDNAIAIDQLIQQYDAWNLENTRQQMQRIHDITNSISQLTGDHGWADIDGLDICYQFKGSGIPAINIEAGFTATRAQAAGEFMIFVTTMGIQAWNHYEDKLINAYPAYEPTIANNKTMLRIASIPGEQHEKIVTTLQQVYACLQLLCGQPKVYKVTVPGVS
jgi:hypothetical protein